MFNHNDIRAYREHKKSIIKIGEQIKPFGNIEYDIQKTIDFLIRSSASASTINNQKALKIKYQEQSNPLRDQMKVLQKKSIKYKTHYEVKIGIYTIAIDFHMIGALVRLKDKTGDFITDPDYLKLGSKVLDSLTKVIGEVELTEGVLSENYQV